MAEIGYENWAFLPVDEAPTSGEPTSFNPPMISTMAIDYQASIIFKFSQATSPLNIEIESTALTAEQGDNSFFQILTGSKPDQYNQVDQSDWELHYDGLHGVFTTQIKRSELYLKLYYSQRQSIIISKVGFSTP